MDIASESHLAEQPPLQHGEWARNAEVKLNAAEVLSRSLYLLPAQRD